MNDDGRGRTAVAPAELWREWFESGTKAWSDFFEAGRESYVDPYGVYRQWFSGLEEMRERMVGGPQLKAPGGATGMDGASPVEQAKPMPAVNPLANVGVEGVQNLWRQWFEAVNDSARRSVSLGTEMREMWPRWFQALEQVRTNFSVIENYPTDPLQFATQWYNATSGPFSDLVADLIEREEFLEQGSRFLQNYASFYKVFGRNSEEYLKSLQLPVRSDITRVAELVVALEEKVDRIEEAFDDFVDSQAELAIAESVANIETSITERIEERVASLDHKLDEAAQASERVATAESVASIEASITERIEERVASLDHKLDESAQASAQASARTSERVATAESVASVRERLAGVERKLDGVAQTSSQAATQATDGLATAESVGNVEGRLDRVEEKLDQLLAAFESASRNGAAATQPEAPQAEVLQMEARQAEVPQADVPQAEAPRAEVPRAAAEPREPELRVTAAARRKAGELGVELADVEGSGAGGQITVGDVRRKGEG